MTESYSEKVDWHFIVMTLYKGKYDRIIKEAEFALLRAKQMNNISLVKKLRRDIKILTEMKDSREKYRK